MSSSSSLAGRGREQPARRAHPIRVKPALAYLLAIGLIGPAAVFKGNNLLIWMLSVLLSMGLFGTILSWLSIKWLTVHRMVPEWGEVGEAMRVRYRVHRLSRWLPSFGLYVSDRLPSDRITMEQAAWIMHVGPGEQVHGDAKMVPLKRGRLRFATIVVMTSFPFGLFSRRRRLRQSRDVVIYPRRHRLAGGVLHMFGAERLDGPRAGRRRGQGREWYGLRPSVGQDSLRDIAWKVTAHRDEIVCIDRAAPSLTRIRVVLDLRTPSKELRLAADRDPVTVEEQAIELAASIIQQFHHEGCEVGLMVPGLLEESTAIRNSSWHLHRLLSRLAELDLSAPRLNWQPNNRHDRSSVVVIRPDRVRPMPQFPDALYLTAGQLDDLRIDQRKREDEP
tara:strand:+ start:141 stop:1313 length:1173 start_codon:yes stop_codon:yes gene_type:complete